MGFDAGFGLNLAGEASQNGGEFFGGLGVENDRLNKILDEHRFDRKVEALCRKSYKKSQYGRPSMAPGVYFRALLIGYFEGLDSERGIAWRVADSLSLRRFLGFALDE